MVSSIHNADCLEFMPSIADGSIDMILCDLPYGTTACHWDIIIPFDALWGQYRRIIKPHGAIVLTASQPFTSALVMSNPKWFRYEWIWKKSKASNFANVRHCPLKEHENILVFGTSIKYNPQKTQGTPYKQPRKNAKYNKAQNTAFHIGNNVKDNIDGLRFPRSILNVPNAYYQDGKQLHPTQKPVALFEYLIRTYTNEGDIVLDNCAGSMTTAIACINTNRKYLCIEKDKGYYETGIKRIEAHTNGLLL